MARRQDIEQTLRIMAPLIPAYERDAIIDQAMDSRGLKTGTPQAVSWLSLIAYIRHQLTDYDQLLDQGYDQDSARYFIVDDINNVLHSWGCKKKIDKNLLK